MHNKDYRVVFVSNDYKTIFNIKIAKRLIKNGFDVSFITFNDYFDKCVSESGIATHRIKYRELTKETDNTLLDYPINDLVFQDHALRQNGKDGHKYLLNFRLKMLSEFDAKTPVVFFGECSRAHETLLARLCKNGEINGAYIVPCTARYPADKFFAFVSEYQHSWVVPSQQFRFTKDNDENFDLNNLSYYQTTLNYLRSKQSFSTLFMKVFRLFWDKIYDLDDVHFSYGRFKFAFNRFKSKLNSLMYHHLVHREIDPDLERPYILFPLQRYPESTVDVIGRFSDNQLEIIDKLSRWAPHGVKIYVKEHKTALGDRSLSFYRRLRHYDNVKLVSENITAKTLIEHALCVVSVSGTVSLEASFKNVPAFICSDCYLNKINGIGTLNETTLRLGFDNAIAELKSQFDIEFNYRHFIIDNCYDGFIGDHLSEPYVLDDDNVAMVAKSFEDIISECKKKNYHF